MWRIGTSLAIAFHRVLFFPCSAVDADKIDLMEMFPDLFGCVYKFAKKQSWNSRATLRKMFQGEGSHTSLVVKSTNLEGASSLSLPVQESESNSVQVIESQVPSECSQESVLK